MKTYVVSGASGKTGMKVAQLLLQQNLPVRVISRNRANVKDLEARGAQVAEGNTDDVNFLNAALKDAQALFALIPVNAKSADHKADQTGHVQAFVQALSASGVTHVVGLSSYGVSLPGDWGIVYGLRKMEEAFGALPNLNTMFLRASYFMENTLGLVPVVKNAGVMAAPVKAALSFPAVSTGDIAQRAAFHLSRLDFTGKNVENLLGPRLVTYPEIASVYGQSVGIAHLAYREVSYQEFKNALVNGAGMSENIADHYVEFTRQMNQGHVYSGLTNGTPDLTPTDIGDFAAVFQRAYAS
jgi:uncharacterized protein YbjT (DUF2867 family)